MDILVSELKKLNGLGEIRDGLNSYKKCKYSSVGDYCDSGIFWGDVGIF